VLAALSVQLVKLDASRFFPEFFFLGEHVAIVEEV
jgi:hypothetical protein